jgi:hypothetical protein
MLQIRTIVNNELKYLDLFNTEDVVMEVSFAEVQDVTQKNSVFSQSFTLPGSKNNNDIFNHFYDTNASTFDYNPKEKFNAQLVSNGAELYRGYLRLDSTTLTNTEVLYSVTFYSEVGDVVSSIKDKFIYELDFSDYDFTGYTGNVDGYLLDDDLDPTLSADTRPYVNGSIYFGIINKGYEYSADTTTNAISDLQAEVIPRLNWTDDNEGWDTTDLEVGYFYTTPSLRIKDIYERIFSEAGYNVESDFFNTAYFKRYYLPLTTSSDSLYLNQAVNPDYSFERIGTPNIPLSSYTWTEIGVGSETQQTRFSNITTITDNMNADVGSPIYFELQGSGIYYATLRFNATASPFGIGDPEDGVSFQPKLRNCDPTASGETPFFTSGYTKYVGPAFPLNVNDSDEFEITFTFSTAGDDLKWYALDLDIEEFAGNVGQVIPSVQDFYFQIYDGPKVLTGDTYNANAELVGTEIKQIDFITSVNKLFNLLVLTNPEDRNTLRVEPVIDWIGKGETLDWSPKVDRDSPIKVQPLSTIVNGTLTYPYVNDEGYTNTTFKVKQDREFGSKLVDLNTDYKDKETKFDNIFAGQVDYTLSQSSFTKALTMPGYYSVETKDVDGNNYNEFKPYKTPPKLLFRSYPIPINSTRKVGNTYFNLYPTTQIRYWYNNNRNNTYPFGAIGLTHYNVWEKNDTFDTQEVNLTGYEDMYDVYYKDYIDDLMNPDNRLVELSVYLTPEEVSNLKFNEKILIDNSYYRINKIKNMSLLEPNVANVELVKLTKDYRPHRVRYYDLVNCTGGTDLHTSTDLNFGVYALVGYNVLINGICYEVTRGVYNPLYTYQRVDLTSPYTTCDCDITLLQGGGFSSFYNELIASPTPTPTQSPTPTPSVTPTITPSVGSCNCRYYSMENTNPYLANVTYKDCYTRELVTTSIVEENTILVCACDDPAPYGDGGVLIEDTGECPTPTPTPTITPTATLTPTPTASVGAYPYYYQVQNCDDPEDILCVGSNTFVAPGKVVQLNFITGCYERITTCSPPVVDVVISTYFDCGSCPR